MTEPRKESFKLDSGQVFDKIRQLIHEGNVRRITVRQGERTIAEFPLTVGVVLGALAPIVAAIGAIAAVLTECTIEVERTDGGGPPPPEAPGQDHG